MQSQHSGLGISSFIVSLICSLLMIALFVIAGMYALANPAGIDEQAPEILALGFAIIFCGAGLLVALGLGIAALCQDGRTKVFGILGLVFSLATLVITIALVIMGS